MQVIIYVEDRKITIRNRNSTNVDIVCKLILRVNAAELITVEVKPNNFPVCRVTC